LRFEQGGKLAAVGDLVIGQVNRAGKNGLRVERGLYQSGLGGVYRLEFNPRIAQQLARQGRHQR
jgi:hypothetical protein